MCEPIEIKHVRIGEGKPKICIPIVGQNLEEIKQDVTKLISHPADLVEWRVDHFEHFRNAGEIEKGLEIIQSICKKPLIFTLRTGREGGKADVTTEEYIELLEAISDSPYIDLVDVEIMTGRDEVKKLVSLFHEKGKAVIVSYHDFDGTPDTEIMLEYLSRMDVSGADILKLAVMPSNRKDVMALLNVTVDMASMTKKPLVTMSMGKAGVLSRLIGEMTGSAITFAIAEKVSAPGQISAGVLEQILDLLHETV